MALDAAAADAAAEQDTEDVDGAAGDAPACPLCLCSRKQVHVPYFLRVLSSAVWRGTRQSSASQSRRLRALHVDMCFAGDVLPVWSVFQVTIM